ncbi:ClpP/crotonase [Decorospora gaudefroyi]|uniref:ClpP/crotonase n=1 Tax=Decorospora gaudefroyi TaxID=184978 RepID=A0A6A5KBB8_9PLEO|nr:ClpP/crotonase [Decorospora gaudefroyi]
MADPQDSYEYKYFNVTFPSEHVAHVEINRPEKLNAFVEVMWQNLSKIFTRLSTNPTIRAILLTGAGPRAFTSGLDVVAASQGGTFDHNDNSQDVARRAVALRRHAIEFQACITAVEKCEKPVIALLHGLAYGLAIDIALAADIRLCTNTTQMSVREVDIGIAADIGTLSRLPHAVGSLSWAKEVCLTGRVFGADEALRVGLVSGVGKDKGEAVEMGLQMAEVIAAKSPVAVVGTKEILNYSKDRTVEEGLRYTAVWNSAMLQTEDIKSAMLSGLQKTTPKFSKL